MLGTFAVGGRGSSPSNNRVFVYEVSGLKQNESSDRNTYPVRNSSTVLVRVPYNRMNEEMMRINRSGGTIVSIQPLESFKASSSEAVAEEGTAAVE